MADISKLLKDFRKGAGSTSAKDSTIMKVDEFLDTGSYAINRVITGDIHKGIPRGRITDIYGESQSGKSWVASNCMIDALNKQGYQFVAYFDSEGGALFNYLEESGVDMDRIEHIPVNSTEDCAVKMINLYDSLVKAANEWRDKPDECEEPKVLVVLDSFGALGSDKIVTDAAKDKMAADMGGNAKLKNSMMKALMMRVAQSNCPLIVINHIYRNPGAMFTSKILEQPGGEGLKFASHVQLQMSKLLVKSNDEEFLTGEESDEVQDEKGFFKGNRIKAFCAKNRVCMPCFEATMYLDFNHGISKYDGLLEDAERMGFIQTVRGGFMVPSYSDKSVSYKEIVGNDKIWDTFIDKFNAESVKRMKYGNKKTAEAIDEIERELDNAEDSGAATLNEDIPQ